MTETDIQYPDSPKVDVVDDFHGTAVADPYRWLEDPATPQSRAWTDAQNKICDQYLHGELREQLHQRLKQICSYQRWSAPIKRGNRYFFWRHDGMQNQPVLYWQSRFTEDPHTLINPNTLSAKGLISIASAVPSRDGKKLAYSLSHSGSDWQEIRIRKVEAGKREDYPEILQHTKFAGMAWHPNHRGFFYNRYPDPSTVADADRTYYNRVYWHVLGTEQEDDVLIYERPDQKDFDFWPQVTEDGKYLLLTVHLGTDRRNRVYYRPLDVPEGEEQNFIQLLDQADAHYRFLGCIHDKFYFFTDKDAPRGRVIVIDLNAPEEDNWQTLIPESEDVLNHIVLAGNAILTVYLHHASSRLFLHNLEGKQIQEIKLPALGSIEALNGKAKDDEVFISFSSFVYPGSVYLFNLKTRILEDVFKPDLIIKSEDYTTRQVFCISKDGTKVPLFLVYRKDLEPLEQRPTLMYGYGGFRHAMTPSFSATLLPWLEMGGVYALVNLRGGLEYGTEWYKAGTLERKQNVFDDFQAAGRFLIDQGITSPEKLAIRGGSNGGLLVGACMTQAPELFGAAVCQVPVLDMLRYHRFTIGRYWVSDYGNAEENPEHFKFLYAYSPLHNVKANVSYPSVLITTADHDDRVVPSHAKKFAATLQAQNPPHPVLLRVDTNAGHGRGKPMTKVIEEFADIYAFLARALKINWQV